MFLSWNLSAEILTVTNINDSGTGSFRRMVEIANSGDSIIFDKSLAGQTLVLQTGIFPTTSISISGKNASVIISGGGISGSIIDNLTFINSGIGDCDLISDCIFDNCTGGSNYGMIGSLGGSSQIINCLFENTKGTVIYDGYSNSYSVTISNCHFINNTNTNNGIIVSSTNNNSSNITITDCTFENDTTQGIINYENVKITNCTFKNNAGPYAVNCSNGNFTVTDCTFSNNAGGAIVGNGNITNCTFENNTTTSGYGLSAIAGGGNITNCTFNNNSANNGGAIYCSYPCNIIDCTFNNNNATALSSSSYLDLEGYGGAINCVDNMGYISYYITNCTFENNNATWYGGAIYGNNFNITNCTFCNNSASNGGAIYNNNYSSPLVGLKGNLFVNNKIIPDNILNDVYNVTSIGYNVYTSNQNTVFSQSTDYRYTGTQSLLVSIGSYGGDTPTMPINTSVPNWESIVRRVPVSTDRTTDQRGLPLPKTGLVCAGAVEMQSNEHYTGINEIKKESVDVYPNPTSGVIHFILNDNSEVQLYDTSGKLVKEQAGKIGSNEISINDLPKGTYFLNANGQTTKIMKK